MSEPFPFLSEYRGKKSRRAEKERKAPVWHSGPLCGSNGAREHPCPSHWRQAGFGPLFPAVLERWFPSRPPFEGRKMKREKYKCHIRPQCGLLPVSVSGNRLEGRFYPPTGGASRAFGLPQAAAKRLFAGGSPRPLYLRKKEDAAVHYTPRRRIPLYCLCAASRETIRVQGSRVPNKPEHRRYAALVGNERGQKPTPREPHMFHSSTEIELSEKHCFVPVSGRFAGSRDV